MEKRVIMWFILMLAFLTFVGTASAVPVIERVVQSGENIKTLTQEYTGSTKAVPGLIYMTNAQGNIVPVWRELQPRDVIYIPRSMISRTPQVMTTTKKNVVAYQAYAKPKKKETIPVEDVPPNYRSATIKKNIPAINLAQKNGNWQSYLQWYVRRGEQAVGVEYDTQLVKGDTLYLPDTAAELSSALANFAEKITEKEENSPPVQYETSDLGDPDGFGKNKKNDWNANFSLAIYRDGGGSGRKRGGHALGAKVGVLPWQYKDVRLGPELRFGTGLSTVDREGRDRSEYRWDELEVTGKAEKRTKRFTASGNLGMSFQSSKKNGTPQEQDTISSVVRANYKNQGRRKDGKKWLPIYDLSARWRHMIDAKNKGGSEEYDESVLAANGFVGIYDYHPTDTLRITPTLRGEAGQHWGKDSLFLGGGPGANIGNHDGANYLESAFWNPRWYIDNGGADRTTAAWVKIKPVNIGKAVQAGNLQDYTPEKETGSKTTGTSSRNGGLKPDNPIYNEK